MGAEDCPGFKGHCPTRLLKLLQSHLVNIGLRVPVNPNPQLTVQRARPRVQHQAPLRPLPGPDIYRVLARLIRYCVIT